MMMMIVSIPKGLGIDGLYRIPGKAMEILEIKKQFDNGERKGREREEEKSVKMWMVHKQLVLYSLYSIEAYLLSNSIFGQQYNNYYCLASQSSNLLLQPNMDPVRVCVCVPLLAMITHTLLVAIAH